MKNRESIYCEILQRPNHFPKNPLELPPRIYLPRIYYDALLESIPITEETGNKRTGSLYYLPHKNDFEESHIYEGAKLGPSLRHMIYRVLNQVAIRQDLSNRQEILFWETHPYPYIYPSAIDTALVSAFPDISLISMIGTNYGISAIFQTAESLKNASQNPFLKTFQVRNQLLRQGFRRIDYNERARMIEKLGFGFYFKSLIDLDESEKIGINNGLFFYRPSSYYPNP